MFTSGKKNVAENCYPLFTSTNFHMKKILAKINVIQEIIYLIECCYKDGQEPESTVTSLSSTVANRWQERMETFSYNRIKDV